VDVYVFFEDKADTGSFKRSNYFFNGLWYLVAATGNLVYSVVWKCGVSFIVSYKEAWNLHVWRFSAYSFPFLPSGSVVEKAFRTSINFPSLCVDNLRIKNLTYVLSGVPTLWKYKCLNSVHYEGISWCVFILILQRYVSVMRNCSLRLK